MFDSEFDPRERGRFESGRGASAFGREGCRHRRPRGPGGGGSRAHGPGRGRRARRGDIRQAILLLLDEGPRNGYGLMQEIEERSGGAWRPSPGSVYPALSQIEDEGLVEMSAAEGRKDFSLTEAGKAWVEEHREEIGTPWDAEGRGMPKGMGSLRKSTQALSIAVRQIAHSGTPSQIEETRKIVDEARRRIYGILAQSEEESED